MTTLGWKSTLQLSGCRAQLLPTNCSDTGYEVRCSVWRCGKGWASYHLGKTGAHMSPCIIDKRPVGPNLWMSTGTSKWTCNNTLSGLLPQAERCKYGAPAPTQTVLFYPPRNPQKDPLQAAPSRLSNTLLPHGILFLHFVSLACSGLSICKGRST